jgi:tRNA modification GTPase
VFNKIDLTGDAAGDIAEDEIHVSAKQGIGLKELKNKLLKKIGWQGINDGVFIARERHLAAIRVAREHLNTADACYLQIEILAEELRLAQNSLNEITGEFTSDDLLGVIFSRFCIGK